MANSLIRFGLMRLGKVVRARNLPAITANPRFALTTADPQGSLEGIVSHADLNATLETGLALYTIVPWPLPSVRAGLAHLHVMSGNHPSLPSFEF